MGEQNVETCLRMLKEAESDNAKFAALMMVPKAIKAKQCDSAMKEKIADAVGLKFLARLLRSAKVPEGCSPNVYKTVALSILSTICTAPAVASSPVMMSLISDINEIFISSPRTEDGKVDEELLGECNNCYMSLSETEEGQRHLLESNSVVSLVEAVITEIHERKIIMTSLVVLNDFIGPDKVWRSHESTYEKLMMYLTTQFCDKKDNSRFDLYGMDLQEFLESADKVHGQTDISNNQWLKKLIPTLCEDLKCKLGVNQRQSVLFFVTEVINKFGVVCFLPPFTPDAKIVLLITHLVCIEVRMKLENLSGEQGPKLWSGNISRDMEISSHTNLLCSCYMILEHLISHMITSQPMGFDEKQVLQVHSAMVGAFNAVLFFLSEIYAEKNKKWLDPVVTASVRVLGAWLAEETTALKQTVYKLLPFLVELLKISLDPKLGENLTAIPLSDEEDNQDFSAIQYNEMQIDPIQPIEQISNGQSNGHNVSELPMDTNQSNFSICNRPKKKVRFFKSEFSREDRHGGCVDLLRFLLPGLCHLSSDEEPRKILISENIQDLLIKYFSSKWQTFVDSKNEDVTDTLASLCGVFLNLCVTEPKLVKSDDSFQSLSQTIYKTLPQIVYEREYLILTANWTTLGLMLLQHQTVQTTESENLSKYLSSCVNFFRHAFCVGKNVDGRAMLTVSEDYQPLWSDISELWFLGLQALCLCAKTCGEICIVMLKSGWLVSLITMLFDVQGSEENQDIIAVELEMLIVLCRLSLPCKDVVKEKGGVALSRIYKKPELERVLIS